MLGLEATRGAPVTALELLLLLIVGAKFLDFEIPLPSSDDSVGAALKRLHVGVQERWVNAHKELFAAKDHPDIFGMAFYLNEVTTSEGCIRRHRFPGTGCNPGCHCIYCTPRFLQMPWLSSPSFINGRPCSSFHLADDHVLARGSVPSRAWAWLAQLPAQLPIEAEGWQHIGAKCKGQRRIILWPLGPLFPVPSPSGLYPVASHYCPMGYFHVLTYADLGRTLRASGLRT